MHPRVDCVGFSGLLAITVNVTVNASTPGGTYVNTATVSVSRPYYYFVAKKTANNNNTVRNTADLAVTKNDGVAT